MPAWASKEGRRFCCATTMQPTICIQTSHLRCEMTSRSAVLSCLVWPESVQEGSLSRQMSFAGWLYRNSVASDAQCIRGHCIKTQRATDPADYIYENMCYPKHLRWGTCSFSCNVFSMLRAVICTLLLFI